MAFVCADMFIFFGYFSCECCGL